MYKKRNKLKGSIIELLSSIYLYNKNYIILDINYYTKWGEVDVIALDYNLIIKYINKNVKNNTHTKNINYKNKLIKICLAKTTLLESYLKSNFKFLSRFTFNDISHVKNSKQLFNQINSLKKDFILLNNDLQIIFTKIIKNHPKYFKLVFVEIKFKSSNKFGFPEQMISTKKVSIIHRVSTCYPQLFNIPKRLDMIAVTIKNTNKVTPAPIITLPINNNKNNHLYNIMSLNKYNNNLSMKNNEYIYSSSSKQYKQYNLNKSKTLLNTYKSKKTIKISKNTKTSKSLNTYNHNSSTLLSKLSFNHYENVYF